MNRKTLISIFFTLVAFIFIVPAFAQSAKRSEASIRAEIIKITKFEELGREYCKSKQYDQSVIMFKKIIKIDTTNEIAWSNLAYVYSLQHKIKESIGCYKKALELSPYWPYYSVQLGFNFIIVENYFDAEKVLLKVVSMEFKVKYESIYENKRILTDTIIIKKSKLIYNSQLLKAYILLGLLYERLARYDTSEQMYKKAIDLDPTEFSSYYSLGNLNYKMKKYDEAIVALDKCIKLDSKNYKAYNTLGRLYSDQGKNDLAEYMLQKAAECDAKNGDLLVNLGDFYMNQKRMEEAEKMYKKAIDVSTQNNGDLLVSLGDFYGKQNRIEEAEKIFKKAIDVYPQNSRAYVYLGLIYEDQGKLNLAEYMYTKAAEILPQEGLYYNFLAHVQLELGKQMEAIKNAKIAKSKGVKNTELYEKLGL